MTKNTRLHIVLLLLICAAILGAASWAAHSALYDRVLKRSEAWHLKVEEVPLTHPQQLRITVDPDQGFMVIREVTTRTNGRDLNILYHLALSGLAKPRLIWGKALTVTVPDSVTSVSFGPASDMIWRRPVADR
jgi:hypothetical protein